MQRILVILEHWENNTKDSCNVASSEFEKIQRLFQEEQKNKYYFTFKMHKGMQNRGET